MKIAISAESTIDLTPELIEKYDIKLVQFTINLGEESFLDKDISPKNIFEFVDKTKTLPKTSAVNTFQFQEHFESLLKDFDAVIHFSLSSEISSACENAKIASEKFNNVFVIDTRSLSTGIALLALSAYDLIKKGLTAKEVFEKIKRRVDFVQASFVLDRLDYLYKGGRCNALVYFGANLLKLHPQILVKDGKMTSGHKYRGGLEKVTLDYVNDTLKEFNNPDKKRVFITYTTSTESLTSQIENILKDKGFQEIYKTTAGATISSHCGENTLGILYINDGGNAFWYFKIIKLILRKNVIKIVFKS